MFVNRTFINLVCLNAFLVVWLIAQPNCQLMAQSNSDLIAPVKHLVLACAEATEDGKLKVFKAIPLHSTEKIEKSSEAEESDVASDKKPDENSDANSDEDSEEQETRMVAQSYTVQVPYVQEVEATDGSKVKVTRMRTETRTRMVARPMTKDGQTVSYQVTVPYTETVMDKEGNSIPITRNRIETRTMVIGKDERIVMTPKPISATVDPKKLKFYNLDGSELPTEKALDRFAERAPIVILATDEPLEDYYKVLFRKNTILVFDESNSIEKAKWSNPSKEETKE